MLNLKRIFELIQKAMLAAKVRLYSFSFVRRVVSVFIRKRVPQKWVFVLGCYNSGTTILRTLLSMHPEIRVLPREGVRFTPLLPRPEDRDWTRMWIGCPEYMVMPEEGQAETADQVIRDWSPWWKRGGSVFVEKSISSLTRVKWLSQNFENAYFIGITRDGYAVTEGIHRRARPKGAAMDKFGDQYPLEWAARQWVDANTKLMAAAGDVDRYLHLTYESLVENPSRALQEIFDFLDLGDATKIEDSEEGVSISGNRVKLFDGNQLSFNRLSDEDLAVITNEISELQQELGYPLR